MVTTSKLQRTRWQVLLRLAPFVSRHALWLVFAVANAAEAVALKMLTPYLLQAMTDRVAAGQVRDLTRLLALAGLLVVTDVGFTLLGRRSAVRYISFSIRDLRDRVSAHIQLLPMGYLDAHHSGDLVSRLNGDVNTLAGWLSALPDLLTQPLLFLAGFIYMLTISPKLLIASCLLIPVSALLFNRITKPMEDFSRRQAEAEGRVNAALQDALAGINLVKAFNLKLFLGTRFRVLVEDVLRQALGLDWLRAIWLAVFLALRYTPQLVVPLYGGYLAFHGEITVGQLLAANLLMWTVFLPIEQLLGILSQARQTVPVAERVLALLDQPAEPSAARPFVPIPGAAAVECASVRFAYGDSKPLLNDVSLAVAPGHKVALVGPSGCGKSTLLKLLCGLYSPQSGSVRICGNHLAQTDLAGVRAQISLVAQDTYLFPTTIARNIGYGRPGATEEEIVAAACAANAHEFIMEQPEGYRTLVGERGAKLSGGQRQRIALARAILKNAPILLLDEPTSALDAQSEALLQEALERFMAERTVLIVAHRLASIRGADHVLVLDGGRIVEQGTHDTLMAQDTLYRRLYLKQVAAGDPLAEQEV